MIFWRGGNIYKSKNDEVWFKTKKEICRGRVQLIAYSRIKEDSEHLEIKGTYSEK